MISFAIMHAPWGGRVALLAELRQRLPMAEVIEDTYRQGIWPTARRAWSAYSAAASHHVVVQDDAELPPDFLPRVHELAEQPAAAVFMNRTHGQPTAVANMLPTALIGTWLSWCAALPPKRQKHDDVLLKIWSRRSGLPIRLLDFVGHRPVPSIRRGHAHA